MDSREAVGEAASRARDAAIAASQALDAALEGDISAMEVAERRAQQAAFQASEAWKVAEGGNPPHPEETLGAVEAAVEAATQAASIANAAWVNLMRSRPVGRAAQAQQDSLWEAYWESKAAFRAAERALLALRRLERPVTEVTG